MKSIIPVAALSALLMLGSTGCKRAPSAAASDRFATGVDWPKLESGFRENTDPNVQASVAAIKRTILYHQFPQAITELDKLSANPSLSESQKKLLGDLRAQTEQVMARSASSQPP